MASSSDMLAKLARVVHMSVPPVILLVLTNSAVSDKVFGVFGAFAKLVSPRLQRVARKLYSVCNAVVVALVLVIVCIQCESVLWVKRTVITLDRTCYPTTVLTGVWLLGSLFADRVVLSLLNAPAARTTFSRRCAHGATVTGVFFALAAKDDRLVFPLLLVAISNRDSAWCPPPRVLKTTVSAMRLGLVCAGVWELIRGTEARRSAALLVLSVICG